MRRAPYAPVVVAVLLASAAANSEPAPTVPDLVAAARAEGDVYSRGLAIAALADVPSKDATAALTALADEEGLDPLVRTWAAAARMRRARSFDELLVRAPDLERTPALEQPFTTRALALVDGGARPELVRLLEVGRERPSAQRALFPVVGRLGVDPLLDVVFTSDDKDLRRLAASHLSSLARRGHHDEILTKLAARLRFSPAARTVPWEGGPLVLPALSLDERDGRALLAPLLRWYLFAELHDEVAIGRPLHDVLRAVGLAAFPGAALPGWYARSSATWLALYKDLAGEDEVGALLLEQGARDDERFRSVLPPPKEAP